MSTPPAEPDSIAAAPATVSARKMRPKRRVVRATVGGKPVRRPVVPSGLVGDADAKRARLADYLKLLSWWLGRPPTPALPPRLEQTLRGLLSGQSEKQIAADLKVSGHTIHEYVKDLHRRLGVASRGELLARFLPTSHAKPTRRQASAAPPRTSGS